MIGSIASTPLLRRRRNRRILLQAVFAVGVGLLLWYLYQRAMSLDVGFGFLDDRAGFGISHTFGFEYSSGGSRWSAYWIGVWNTVRLILVGIALATVIGIAAGVARLSSNWLVSRLAAVYVEVFRNTPLLVQLVFWYTAALLPLPPISRALDLFGAFYLSNRAVVVPWATAREGVTTWIVIVAVGGVAAWLIRRWRIAVEERTGRPGRENTIALAVFMVLAVSGFLATGRPLQFESPDLVVPERGVPRIVGGMSMTPEFAALLFALSIYTAAFIAEIVRGAIQSLPHGQTEAAQAIGLSGGQRLTLIILPQALRIMIPPLTNQYLNLTKNSSLAVAVAYPELVSVGRTLINNAGNAIPVFLLIMATYLAMSLVIAVLMGLLNRRVQMAGS